MLFRTGDLIQTGVLILIIAVNFHQAFMIRKHLDNNKTIIRQYNTKQYKTKQNEFKLSITISFVCSDKT